MARGCLQAQLTADGAWQIDAATLADGADTLNITTSGTNYYITELLTALQNALNAFSTDTWTVTGSFGESGTGQVTIDCDGTDWSITWTDTNLRDAIGFTADIVSVNAPQTGANHAKGVFLPTCSLWSKYGASDAGNDLTDTIYSVSPRGDVLTLTSQRRQENVVRWSHVSHARARIAGETVTGESFQQWWRDCHLGELAYCSPGAKVRVIWDASVPGTYTEYYIVDSPDLDPTTSVPGYIGLIPVELKLVKVPS